MKNPVVNSMGFFIAQKKTMICLKPNKTTPFTKSGVRMSERLLAKLVNEGVDSETIKAQLREWRNSALQHLASVDDALLAVSEDICSPSVINELRILVGTLYQTFENKRVIPSTYEVAFEKLERLVLPILREQLRQSRRNR